MNEALSRVQSYFYFRLVSYLGKIKVLLLLIPFLVTEKIISNQNPELKITSTELKFDYSNFTFISQREETIVWNQELDPDWNLTMPL